MISESSLKAVEDLAFEISTIDFNLAKRLLKDVEAYRNKLICDIIRTDPKFDESQKGGGPNNSK